LAEEAGVDLAVNAREVDPYNGCLHKVVKTVYHLNFKNKKRYGDFSSVAIELAILRGRGGG